MFVRTAESSARMSAAMKKAGRVPPSRAGMEPWNKGAGPPLGTCSKCGATDKPMCSGGVRKPYCKDCYNQAGRAAYSPANDRPRQMKHRYGVDAAWYARQYDAQGGKCAVCQAQRAVLCIDHHHESGQVRALLCRGCNVMIGSLEHPKAGLALEYISNYAELRGERYGKAISQAA
jgi:hypothetical protein